MIKKRQKFLFGLCLSVLNFVFVKIVFAAENITYRVTSTSNNSCMPDFFKKFEFTVGSSTQNAAQGLTNICTAADLIKFAIDGILLFAGSVAVLFIMVGGFWYLSSGGNEETAEKGRKTLMNSIIGLVVIIMAYAVVRVIANVLVTNLGGGASSSTANSTAGNTTSNTSPSTGNGSTAVSQGVRLSTDASSMYYSITNQDVQDFKDRNINVLSNAVSPNFNTQQVVFTVSPSDKQAISQLYVDCSGGNVQTLSAQMSNGTGPVAAGNSAVFVKNGNGWTATVGFDKTLSGATSVEVYDCGHLVNGFSIPPGTR